MEKEKQKTAVEWLAEKMLYIDNEYDMKLITKSEYHAKRRDIIEESKEMFKKQIEDAYSNGRYDADKIVMTERFYSEQYYNKTFKQQEQ